VDQRRGVMTATTVPVNVTIAANGASPSLGVTFTFAAGANMPSGVTLKSDGSLDFSKLPKGTVVSLVFTLLTSSLPFGSSTIPLQIVGQNGPPNACAIGLTNPPTVPYAGTQFTFAPNSLPPSNNSLSIIDNNNDGNTYYYELFVWLGGAASLKFG